MFMKRSRKWITDYIINNYSATYRLIKQHLSFLLLAKMIDIYLWQTDELLRQHAYFTVLSRKDPLFQAKRFPLASSRPVFWSTVMQVPETPLLCLIKPTEKRFTADFNRNNVSVYFRRELISRRHFGSARLLAASTCRLSVLNHNVTLTVWAETTKTTGKGRDTAMVISIHKIQKFFVFFKY